MTHLLLQSNQCSALLNAMHIPTKNDTLVDPFNTEKPIQYHRDIRTIDFPSIPIVLIDIDHR